MMYGKKNKRRMMSEINVVPYIDVMLVLLVIFMITAPLLSQGVEVNLPKASAEALSSKQKEPLIVSVDENGQYFLNVSTYPEQPVLAAPLMTRIAAELALSKQRHEDRAVLVRGDRDVDYGRVIQLMVLLQQAGVENIGLMTEDPENE